MREIRPSGSEGGVAITPPSLPLSVQQNGDGLVQCDLAPDASQVPEVFVVPAKAADMQDDSIQTIHFRLSGPLWRSSFHPDDQQFDKSEADVRFRVSFP